MKPSTRALRRQYIYLTLLLLLFYYVWEEQRHAWEGGLFAWVTYLTLCLCMLLETAQEGTGTFRDPSEDRPSKCKWVRTKNHSNYNFCCCRHFDSVFRLHSFPFVRFSNANSCTCYVLLCLGSGDSTGTSVLTRVIWFLNEINRGHCWQSYRGSGSGWCLVAKLFHRRPQSFESSDENFKISAHGWIALKRTPRGTRNGSWLLGREVDDRGQ